VLRDEEVHYDEHIVGEAGVVKRRRKRLGAAAVAHIHADDVATSTPELVRIADHVLRVRRAFQSVHDDGGRSRRANLDRLPMTLAEHLACDLACSRGRDLDKLWLGWWQTIRTRQIVAGNSLQVAVAEKTSWLKLRGVDGGWF